MDFIGSSMAMRRANVVSETAGSITARDLPPPQLYAADSVTRPLLPTGH